MKQAKRFIVSFLALALCTIMYAQEAITGNVVDQTGEPVIGATVMEKGTSNGTVTDFDGNFSLKVAAGKTIVFSYIGYQTVELPAANGMKVTMQDDAFSLNEVVVTGYTTQRKADLTGAVSVVSVSLWCCYRPHPWYRYVEQQRPALHHRWCSHQGRHA